MIFQDGAICPEQNAGNLDSVALALFVLLGSPAKQIDPLLKPEARPTVRPSLDTCIRGVLDFDRLFMKVAAPLGVGPPR